MVDKRILELRNQIDQIDDEIISLLLKRMEVSRSVGELKAELHIPIEDKSREETIIQKLTDKAGEILTEEQLIRIFTAVFKSSKQIQK